MEININGQAREVVDSPGNLLLWTLRDELGMTGTKFGCGAGICGACTVHVDGVATRSCITPLASVAGKSVRTIEGLATVNATVNATGDEDMTLHPVQQAFIDAQVPQCGWCMSGQIMTAAAFLEANANPTDEELVSAMGQNYCRCGCYVRIKQAVSLSAERMAV